MNMLPIRSFMFRQSGLSFHYPQTSRLLPAIRQNATSLSFQCRCTKMDNPLAGVHMFYSSKLEALYIGRDSGLLKQYVPKLPNLHIHWFIWMVVSSLLLLTVTLRPGSNKKEPRNVSFDDLVGVDEAILEFQMILCRLKRKIECTKPEVKLLPVGVLVYGPPGTGKTTLVHAMAREARVSFFPVSAKDIGYDVDDTKPLRIKGLFNEARRHSPSIIFIEDIDVLTGHCEINENNLTIQELYNEMEEWNNDESTVLVIASTKKPEKLDPSLMDYGRFYRKVHMGKPDEDCRRKIVGLYLNKFLLEEDKEAICNFFASEIPGLVGRDIKSIAEESYLLSVRRGSVHVTMDDVVQAIEMFKHKIGLNI